MKKADTLFGAKYEAFDKTLEHEDGHVLVAIVGIDRVYRRLDEIEAKLNRLLDSHNQGE